MGVPRSSPPFFLSGDRRSEAAATVKRVRVEETIKGRVGEAKTMA